MIANAYRDRSGHSPRLVGAAAMAALLLALSACGTTRQGAVTPPSAGAGAGAPERQGNWRGRERIREAIADLNRGDAVAARRALAAALSYDANDSVALQLIRQIDTEPRQLLGTESYSYTLREGETLSTVAQRALGSPLMFYALARYNNIAVPTSVVPGQTILVPGRRPVPPPAPVRHEPPRTTPARPAPAPGTAAPAPRPAPRGNPAAAARLRGQGLSALNSGNVDRAVALLRQALAQDPDNGAIRSDLNRAMRVQSTVRSRR